MRSPAIARTITALRIAAFCLSVVLSVLAVAAVAIGILLEQWSDVIHVCALVGLIWSAYVLVCKFDAWVDGNLSELERR